MVAVSLQQSASPGRSVDAVETVVGSVSSRAKPKWTAQWLAQISRK